MKKVILTCLLSTVIFCSCNEKRDYSGYKKLIVEKVSNNHGVELSCRTLESEFFGYTLNTSTVSDMEIFDVMRQCNPGDTLYVDFSDYGKNIYSFYNKSQNSGSFPVKGIESIPKE